MRLRIVFGENNSSSITRVHVMCRIHCENVESGKSKCISMLERMKTEKQQRIGNIIEITIIQKIVDIYVTKADS